MKGNGNKMIEVGSRVKTAYSEGVIGLPGVMENDKEGIVIEVDNDYCVVKFDDGITPNIFNRFEQGTVGLPCEWLAEIESD